MRRRSGTRRLGKPAASATTPGSRSTGCHPGDVKFWDFNDQVLMAAVPRFYTSFVPERGDALPTSLSRHAVLHQPTLAHFNESNALLSIMLVCSILRSEQERIEEVRYQDRFDDPDYAED